MTDEQKTETKPDERATGGLEPDEQAHPVDPGIRALAQGKDDGGGGPAPDTEDPAKLRKEAAGYRRRLRETEAERDKLRARVEDADRAEVERAVTGDRGLTDPADFWLAVQLDDLRDEDGALDKAKIEAARDRVLADRPHWRKPAPNFDGGARESAPDPSGPSFGAALKKAARS